MSDELPPGILQIENEVWARGFTTVPNALLHARNLSAEARFLLILLMGYAWTTDKVWPGQGRLVTETGWSENTVRKYLRELEDGRFVRIERRPPPATTVYVLADLESVLLKDAKIEPLKIRGVKGSKSAAKESQGNKTKGGEAGAVAWARRHGLADN
jgi:hypothetical protein